MASYTLFFFPTGKKELETRGNKSTRQGYVSSMNLLSALLCEIHTFLHPALQKEKLAIIPKC